MPNQRENWLSAAEAAEELGLRQAVVLALIEAGRLAAEETSAGILLVRRADVERFRDRSGAPAAREHDRRFALG